MAYLLKARTVKPAEMAIAKLWLCKYVYSQVTCPYNNVGTAENGVSCIVCQNAANSGGV
jgi:hypothetical protein